MGYGTWNAVLFLLFDALFGLLTSFQAGLRFSPVRDSFVARLITARSRQVIVASVSRLSLDLSASGCQDLWAATQIFVSCKLSAWRIFLFVRGMRQKSCAIEVYHSGQKYKDRFNINSGIKTVLIFPSIPIYSRS